MKTRNLLFLLPFLIFWVPNYIASVILRVDCFPYLNLIQLIAQLPDFFPSRIKVTTLLLSILCQSAMTFYYIIQAIFVSPSELHLLITALTF